MADYLTQTLIERAGGVNKLVQLTNDTGAGNAVDTDVLDQCIDAAEADVNACLNKGYTLPITVADHGQPAFNAVVQMCIRAVRYHLMARRPEMVARDGQIVEDYKAALELAIEMSKGHKAMPGDPPVVRSGPEAPFASIDTVSDLTSTERGSTCPVRKWTRESQG